MAYRAIAKFDDQTIRAILHPGRNLIGSDPSCEVCLPNPTVSRRHAVLTVEGDRIELADLGSTNGTLVRSRRIDREEVQPDDIFVIGRVLVVLEEIPDDDLEIGIRVGVDPSGKIVDLDALQEQTDSYSPLDRFALDHLPWLLDHLFQELEAQDLAQKVGYALFETMPVASVEIAEVSSKDKGVLFTAERQAEETTLPHWTESSRARLQIRACFHTQRAAKHFQPVIDSAALILALAERRSAVAAPAAAGPPAAVKPPPPERPQPPTVDPEVRRIYDQAERVARGDVGVMIYGESGTGKEVLANFIHAASPRAGRPMMAINCASLPRDLLEAELFGVERGVATGVEARPGKFESADGGTLFLDEIGDMAPETQAKILRVLQEKEVYRIGGNLPRPAEARIVAATNRPLAKLIAEGSFRNDLYHRIATWEVELPPLRHRRADIDNLAAHFLIHEAARHGVKARGISRAALRALRRYKWPGNIRQLRNEISRAVLFLENKELLDTKRLSPVIHGADEQYGTSLATYLASVEKEELLAAIEAFGGDTQAAADHLKMSRSTFYRRLKVLGLETKGLK